MLYLSQVNFGTSASLLGIIYVILAVVYFILMVILLAGRASRLHGSALALYIIQAMCVPVLMLLSGLILVFQGWRLDSTFEFQQFLLLIIIIYLSIKDIVINAVYRNR